MTSLRLNDRNNMIELEVGDGRTITLNSQQEAAVNNIFEWYHSGDKLFRLSGFAGTGKTTITKHVIAKLQEQSVLGRSMRICVAAPTHKAVKVIHRATDFPGHTLARLLGMSADIGIEEFDPEKPEFKQKKPPIIGDYDLVILDEISMVNTPLFEVILKEVKKSSTVRVIFLGDSFQTPPIGEAISPVFTSHAITWASELTQVERQDDDDPVLGIHVAIRGNPNSDTDLFEHVSAVNSKGHGIQFLENSEFAKEVLAAFTSEAYTEDPDYAKILCWSNKQCRYWNTNLRRRRMQALHLDNVPPLMTMEIWPIMQEDVMMAFNGYENKLANSNDYLVLRVEESEMSVRYPTSGGAKVVRVKTFGVWMVNVDTGRETFTHVLDQRDEDNQSLWMKAYWAYINQAKKNASMWKQFFEFRSWVMLYEDIPLGYEGKKKIGKDLDYGYAITVHKSTGSSYENVFVDGSNINENWVNSERNRLKYVALSRQRKMAYYRE